MINPRFDWVGDFARNGLAAVKVSGKWGYIDKTGSFVINAQFDGTTPFFDDGYALVEVGESYGIIDKTGNYVVNPQFSDVDLEWFVY